jgi:mannose-6-phosphate isomerase-like protein (cupin superfamily)
VQGFEARRRRGDGSTRGRALRSSCVPSGNFVPALGSGQLGGPDSDFVIVEWEDSGDSEYEWIAPLHVHHGDDEAWYVLNGALRFRIGDEMFEAGPGSAVSAPKGSPHAYGNARRGQPARYLLVMTPTIRELVRALHEPGAGDYAAIFRAHNSELLA